MNLLVAWLVFPALLSALALGLALLAEQIGRFRLPGALVLPFGAVLLVAVVQLATISDATAELAVPIALGLAVAGMIVSPPWKRGRVDPWIAGAALLVFACYAAPIVASGDPSFAGYVKLDDTATWLGQVDRLMEHGRSLEGLAPSSYEAALDSYLPRGAPVGAMLPLGTGSVVLAADPAWLIQPCMAWFAAMLSLSLSELARPLAATSRARAAVAAVAAQPALLVSYVMWGGIKEVAAIAALAVVAATVPLAIAAKSPFTVLPAAAASAALLAILGPAGGIWLAPMMLIALVLLVRSAGGRVALGRALGFTGVALVLSVPLLTGNAFEAATGSVLYAESELGNLFEPLEKLQAVGIWPVGDFRSPPGEGFASALLIAVALASALIGAVLAYRARAIALLLLAGGGLASLAAIQMAGSPWVDGKALATFAPAVLALAMAGAAGLAGGRWRPVGLIAGSLVAAGVLWSNALGYREINIAPYDQLRELEQLGEDLEGQGPALMTNYEPYGVRHFLREADPEGVSELRRRVTPRLDGSQVEKGASADTDELDPEGLLAYRTLVLRRGPGQSRPPSPYELVDRRRFYEVWQRAPGPLPSVEHVPLGAGPHPAEPWDCAELEQLSEAAGSDGELLYVERPANVLFSLADFEQPGTWTRTGSDVVFPDSEGTATLAIELPRPGTWRIWLGGTWRGELTLVIDGRQVAQTRHSFNYFHYEDLGAVELGPGTHDVELRYSGPDLHPGSAGVAEPAGPLVFSRERGEADQVQRIPATEASRLCGRRLDWVEVVTG